MRTLGHASMSRQTPQGQASVAWCSDGDVTLLTVELDVVIPPGASADLHLPLLLPLGNGNDVVIERRVLAGGCAIHCDVVGLATAVGACDGYDGAL